MLIIVCHGLNGLVFKDKIIYLLLYIFLEYYHVSALPHISHGYPHINFCLLLLLPKPQMPVYQGATASSEVVMMLPVTSETFASPPQASLSKFNEDTEHTFYLP